MSSLWKFWVKGNQADRVEGKARRMCSDKHPLAHQSLPRTPSEVVVKAQSGWAHSRLVAKAVCSLALGSAFTACPWGPDTNDLPTLG